jgi:hypothetical protein
MHAMTATPDLPSFTNGGGLLLLLLVVLIVVLALAMRRPRCCRCHRAIPRREGSLTSLFEGVMCVDCYVGTFR